MSHSQQEIMKTCLVLQGKILAYLKTNTVTVEPGQTVVEAILSNSSSEMKNSSLATFVFLLASSGQDLKSHNYMFQIETILRRVLEEPSVKDISQLVSKIVLDKYKGIFRDPIHVADFLRAHPNEYETVLSLMPQYKGETREITLQNLDLVTGFEN